MMPILGGLSCAKCEVAWDGRVERDCWCCGEAGSDNVLSSTRWVELEQYRTDYRTRTD